MRPPRKKTYWIGGDKWSEEWVPHGDEHLLDAAGVTLPAERRIYLDADYLGDDHEAAKLVLHERLHAVIHSMDICWDRAVEELEEDIVGRLVQGIVATFRGRLRLRGM